MDNFYPCNFGGGGIANNLITTEEGYSLDARQGKVLNDYISQVNTDLLKKIQASGHLGTNVNWNNYVNAGVYKVQNATMTAEYHAPVGVYAYGLLIVIVSETSGEHRIAQIYIPDNDRISVVATIRTRNNNVWQKWRGITGTILQ